MLLRRALLLGFCFLPLVALLNGCGSGVSGPNPNTQTGLGTLIVQVYSGDRDRDLIVFLDKTIQPVQKGRATFYNVTPGKYNVRALSQQSGFSPIESVTIVADQTLTIGVTIEDYIPSPTPTILGL